MTEYHLSSHGWPNVLSTANSFVPRLFEVPLPLTSQLSPLAVTEWGQSFADQSPPPFASVLNQDEIRSAKSEPTQHWASLIIGDPRVEEGSMDMFRVHNAGTWSAGSAVLAGLPYCASTAT